MPIFISYSSKDQKAAEAICTAIENRGHSCWISSRDIGPGENFQSQIVHAIRSAKIMVLVFSSNANNSEEIKKELVLAGQSRLVVIPVRVEDVTPDDAFAYEFATRQWIDVFGDWEHAVQRIVHQIEAVIGEPPKSAGAREAEAHDQGADSAKQPARAAVPGRKKLPMTAILGAAAAIIVVLAGAVAWQLWPKGGSPAAPVAAVAPPAATPAAAPATQTAPNKSTDAAPAISTAATEPPAVTTAAATRTPEAAASPPTAPAEPAPPPTQAAAVLPPPNPPQTSTGAAPRTFRDCPNCPEMVVIAAGTFQMGTAPGENERFGVPPVESGRDGPQHQVTFAHPFAIAKFDITFGEFTAFAQRVRFNARSGCMSVISNAWRAQPQASWQQPGYEQTERDPVVCINMEEISDYLGWLHRTTGKYYRLPSEAEWEYAERAGTTTAYYWGDDIKDACAYENVGDQAYAQKYGTPEPIPCSDGFSDIAPVGSFKPNPWGLYDMAGNIFVMTADCWNETYTGAPTDGSAWMSGECNRHVVRKAAYGNPHPWMFRSANRGFEGDNIKRNRVGFRVALSLP